MTQQFPAYLVLHVKRVDVPEGHMGRGGQQQVRSQFLQPPLRQMLPLPMTLFEDQHDGHAHAPNGPATLHFTESFADVMTAMQDACDAERLFAIPIQRDAIEAAAADAIATGLGIVRTHIKPEDVLAPKPPQIGDLRVNEWPSDGDPLWMVEWWAKDEDGNEEWTRNGVMPDLRGRYRSKDDALDAIRVAGYIRRLYVEA